MDPLQNLWDLYEGYKSPPMDKVRRKVHSLDTEKKLGMGSPKKDKRRMKMDMLAYVDSDPETRSLHRGAKQAIERNNKQKFRQKMEEALDELVLAFDEDFQQKPTVQAPTSATMGSPNEGSVDHPVIQKRAQVDQLRASGAPTGDAHEKVHGDVNLADVTMKSDVASTFGRVQDDGNSKNVHIDTKADAKSVMALDAEMELKTKLSPDMMRTTIPKETQTLPDETGANVPVDTAEEYDYNEDIMYLQTYGRA